ncbi:hypothetical protein [Amycolatopsis sp. NPDC059657]|uniref:hypothetical protein n=1 Tax=Amycolatopsis sp. NPDC059657 TaxID=3346899 RepID=UPI00366F074D
MSTTLFLILVVYSVGSPAVIGLQDFRDVLMYQRRVELQTTGDHVHPVEVSAGPPRWQSRSPLASTLGAFGVSGGGWVEGGGRSASERHLNASESFFSSPARRCMVRVYLLTCATVATSSDVQVKSVIVAYSTPLAWSRIE